MRFDITFDYLCPFARNVNEAIISGLRSGEAWEPRYRAFSLSQVHLDDDEPAVWDRSSELPSGVLALAWGLAVRDHDPGHFLDAHLALFAARHDHGLDIGREQVVRDAVASAGVDVDAIADVVATGGPLRALGDDHTWSVANHQVFGVPTRIADGDAVYLRMMRHGDVEGFRRVLDLASWTDLNEFKRTTIPR